MTDQRHNRRVTLAKKALPLLRDAIDLLDEAECITPQDSTHDLAAAYVAAVRARQRLTSFLRRTS